MEVWDLIENHFKCEVPTYIKNILEVCGYTNALTIASIVEDDIEYFEGEVKNGNVTKHFGDVKKALEGSNKSDEKDFQIVRGHQRFIFKISEFLKGCVKKNGPESFVIKSDTSNETSELPEKLDEENIRLFRKRKNESEKNCAKSKVKVDYPESISEEEMNQHRNAIFKKFMKSLESETRNMLGEVKDEITFESVKTEIEKSMSMGEPSTGGTHAFKLVGAVLCPYCKKHFAVHHEPSQRNFYIWKITNWVRHLKSHKDKANDVRHAVNEAQTKVVPTSVFSSINSDVACTEKKFELQSIDFPKNEEQHISVNAEPPQELECHVQPENSEVGASCLKKISSFDTEVPFNLVNYSDSSDDEDCLASDCRADAVKKHIKPNEDADEVVTISAIDMVDRRGKHKIALETANVSTSVSIPIFRNGYTSIQTVKNRKQTIVTINTCGFDSIFAIYTCMYFDDEHFRDNFKGDSKFAMLIKTYFELFSSKTGHSSSQLIELYTSRNHILMELFNQKIIEKDGMIYIDCMTGIGKLFGQLSKEMCPLISSGIETKSCQKCKKAVTFFIPFIPIAPIDLDFRNLQNYLRFTRPRNRTYLCQDCKGNCTVKIRYNNIVVLEVEPCTVRVQKKIAIQSLTDTIVVEKENFHLFGVIEYNNNLKHFKSHILRKSGKWMTYDDIQLTENEIEKSFLESEGISPFLLFYQKQKFDSSCSDALVEGMTRDVSVSKNRQGLGQGLKEKNWKY